MNLITFSCIPKTSSRDEITFPIERLFASLDIILENHSRYQKMLNQKFL